MEHPPMPTLDGIQPNVLAALPEDAQIVEHTADGGVIARVPTDPSSPKAEKVPVIDPDTGEQRVRRYSTQQGEFETPVWRWKTEVDTELIKFEPRKTGRVVKNRNFQESERERRARERRQEVESFKDELAEEAVQRGVSVSDLLAAIQGRGEEDAEATAGAPQPPGEPVETGEASENGTSEGQAPEADLPDDYELTQQRPGVWHMPDGSLYPEEGTATKAEAIGEIARRHGPEAAQALVPEG